MENPCLRCTCYDPDMGCTMPSYDKWYACPIYDNTKDLAEILYGINKDMDFRDYSDTEKNSIENLANDISKARELGLEYLISALECICMGEVYGKLEQLHELGFRANLLINKKETVVYVPRDLNSNNWAVEIQGEPTRYLISFDDVLRLIKNKKENK